MINTLLRYFAIVAVLIALMGVTHLGMQAMGAGANGQAPTANGEFAPRPDASRSAVMVTAGAVATVVVVTCSVRS
jgi:hypothetical protein